MQANPKQVHFIGIGGAGMSGIATVLQGLGHRVSGSDMKSSETTKRLTALGVQCYTGHRAEHLGAAEMVVVSTAIPETNPEFIAAREKGLEVIHRGEMLARLMLRQKGIAVAGAHGKTTTTSMIAQTLEVNGLDPTIIIGGDLKYIGGNAKLGRGDYLVAEADESDGSFLRLSPLVAVVTNIENDHLDHYGSQERIVAAFKEFIQKVPDHGLAVLCLDDHHIQELLPTVQKPVLTYGLECQGADYVLKNLSLVGKLTAGDVYFRGEKLGRLELPVPGRHNLLNALATVAVGRFAGLNFTQVAAALSKFQGAGRRFELLGLVDQIKVVDDYAHHPTEIKATIKAARESHPGRLIVVFQPHRYTRTQLLQREFGAAFSEAGTVIVNAIYSAGEKPIPGVTARLIVDAIKAHDRREVAYFDTLDEIADYLADTAEPGDLIITMGAGNIRSAGEELVRRLEGR